MFDWTRFCETSFSRGFPGILNFQGLQIGIASEQFHDSVRAIDFANFARQGMFDWTTVVQVRIFSGILPDFARAMVSVWSREKFRDSMEGLPYLVLFSRMAFGIKKPGK